MNGSIPVSMISIMAVSPDFCYQQIKEAVVGKTLQKYISILRRNIKNLQLQADIV